MKQFPPYIKIGFFGDKRITDVDAFMRDMQESGRLDKDTLPSFAPHNKSQSRNAKCNETCPTDSGDDGDKEIES